MRTLAALVLSSAVALLAGYGDASGADPKRRDRDRPPVELWQQFPLGTKRLAPLPRPTTTRVPAPQPPAVIVSPPPSGSDRGLLTGAALLFVLGGAVLIGIAAVVIARETRHRRQAAQHAEKREADAWVVEARALARTGSEWDNYAQRLALWTGGLQQPSEVVMSDADREADKTVSMTPAEVQVVKEGALDVGSRVNLILQAADETADRIREDAWQAAAATQREADAAAAQRLEEARLEAEKMHAEAEAHVRDTRAAGDTYATQRRREVDQEVSRLLTEGEQQARATREAAEAMAKQIEGEALARINELEERTVSAEARLQRILVALRDTAGQVEEVLVAGRSGADTLIEALDVQARSSSD